MEPSSSHGSQILITLIRIYQCLTFPFGPSCRFTPTCSSYAIEAIQKFGMIQGSWLIIKRIFKCHPLNKGGEDSLP